MFILTGCGGSYEPEIIMPDEPMKSALDSSAQTAEESGDKKETSEVTHQMAEDENYKIWLITMDQKDQYWLSINKGCEKAVSELGNIDYLWNSPDVFDDEKQMSYINEAVAQEVDAILLAANGPQNVNKALENAQNAGTKIIFVDSAADFPCVQSLTTDNEAAGTIAGNEMIEQLKEKGITSGKIGILNLKTDAASTKAREAGFRAAFEGTEFELLDTVAIETNDDAATATSQLIEQGCVGIFATNETSTVGLGKGVKNQQAEIVGIGFDTSDTVLGLINEGYLKATVAQKPETMGYEGIKTAIDALEGKKIEEEQKDTGVSIITKDDM